MSVVFRPGRLPHDPRPPRLRLTAYQTAKPAAPLAADWASKVRSWPMSLNDQIGDCTAAGAGHIAQQVNWYGRDLDAPIADPDTLAFYRAISGYIPGDPSSDVGATLQDALSYWRTTGVGGNRIAAYAQLDASDLDTVRACIATFGSVYCGMWFPQSAEDQFNAGRPWAVVKRSANLGGHCVPIVAYDPDTFTCITWGQAQRLDVNFFRAQFDECWTVIDLDWLRATGVSPAGLDTRALNADFTALTGQAGPFPNTPAPQPTPTPGPPVTADETFARQLHAWLANRPHFYPQLRADAQAWLAAKGL